MPAPERMLRDKAHAGKYLIVWLQPALPTSGYDFDQQDAPMKLMAFASRCSVYSCIAST